MTDRWIVTPQFFEQPEPGLTAFAPPEAARNGPVALQNRGPGQMARLHAPIAGFVADTLARGDRPVSLAGDCCAALPVLSGCQRAGLSPWLVWIDAHGDFNTPETSPSQFLGGMPLAMIAGRGPQWMMEGAGAGRMPEDRIVLVDARDLDPLEAEAVAGSALRHITVAGMAGLQPDGPVLLHIDMDVIDSAEAPAFNYPVPDGPSAAILSAALTDLTARADIRAVSISAWSPSKDADGQTGRACASVLATCTEGVRSPAK